MKGKKKVGKIILIIVIIIVVLLLTVFLGLKFFPPIGDTPNKEDRKEYGENTNLYYDKQFHNENAFSLSNHAWYDPPQRAVSAAQEQGVNLATPRIGQSVSYDNISSYNSHWWEACLRR